MTHGLASDFLAGLPALSCVLAIARIAFARSIPTRVGFQTRYHPSFIHLMNLSRLLNNQRGFASIASEVNDDRNRGGRGLPGLLRNISDLTRSI